MLLLGPEALLCVNNIPLLKKKGKQTGEYTEIIEEIKIVIKRISSNEIHIFHGSS